MLESALFQQPVERVRESLEWVLEVIEGDQVGRIEFWELPIPNHVYVIGSDHSYGMEGRDYDAAVVLDSSVSPYMQVAEAEGHWGEQFDRVLYALGRIFNDAWICGETQLGLYTLRRMLSQWGYPYLYYRRNEFRRGRPPMDVLGWWQTGKYDLALRRARLAVRRNAVQVRSPSLLGQIQQFAWIPRAKSLRRRQDARDELRDADLIAAAAQGHDDLVMALVYGNLMAEEAPEMNPIPFAYPEGTLGAILGHAEILDEPREKSRPADPFRRAR